MHMTSHETAQRQRIMATILEIARRLNISHSTVSRVLSGQSTTPISEETRRRVLHAAQEMGYSPNLAARSMRDSRSNLVALFASPLAGIWSGISPDIVRKAVPVLQEHGLDAFFAFSVERNIDEIPPLPAWKYDASLILQHPTRETIDRVKVSRKPCIAINELIPGFSCVLSDEAEGVRQAVAHLVALGHRRIAYANATGNMHLPHYSIEERHSAYLNVMQDFGLAPLPGHDIRPHDGDRVEFVRQVYLSERATAILSYDHVIAMDLFSAASELRYRIPTDLSLISFNDAFPLERLNPPISIINLKGNEMGISAANALIEQIKAGKPAPPSITRIKPEFRERRSTSSPRNQA